MSANAHDPCFGMGAPSLRLPKKDMKVFFIRILVIGCILINAIPLVAEDTLSVILYTWDDATPGIPFDTPAAGLTFPSAGNATTEEPWVWSPQFIRLVYNSDALIWGIRIVTDNNLNMDPEHKGLVYPKPLNIGPDLDKNDPDIDNVWEWELHPEWGGKYKYEGGEWLTGDDSVSFGGLIDQATKDNPVLRATLAWQVYRDPVPEPDPIYKNWQGIWNVGGNWNDDWAYISDRNDRWNGEPSVPTGPDVDSIFYTDTWNARYEMVVTGNPVVNYLTQHPVVSGSKNNPDPKPGDCDVAVYIAVCFGVLQNGVFVDTLPKGNYQTIVYFELLHE